MAIYLDANVTSNPARPGVIRGVKRCLTLPNRAESHKS
jgi:hypothetical protein